MNIFMFTIIYQQKRVLCKVVFLNNIPFFVLKVKTVIYLKFKHKHVNTSVS